MGEVQLLQVIDKVGALGLAFVLWLITSRRYVHVKELERESARADKLEDLLFQSLNLGTRAAEAGRKMAAQLPASKE